MVRTDVDLGTNAVMVVDSDSGTDSEVVESEFVLDSDLVMTEDDIAVTETGTVDTGRELALSVGSVTSINAGWLTSDPDDMLKLCDIM